VATPVADAVAGATLCARERLTIGAIAAMVNTAATNKKASTLRLTLRLIF